MALTPEKRALKGTGTGTRFVIGGQVVLAALLALAAVVLVTWLSERRGLRWRTDLTASGENTLDPVSSEVILKLEGDVEVDVFFTAPEEPFQQVGPIVQDRMLKLLRRATDESSGKIHVTLHDLSDRAELPPASKARMVELNLAGIEPGGLFVVSMGKRREIVRLRPDIADIDPGQPDRRMGPYIPARIVNFRGEEALVSALFKVARGDAPKVLFTSGHGERDTKSVEQLGLAGLARELEGDGFVVGVWDSAKSNSISDDVSVLAILGPEQLFTAAESAEIRRFVESGGRLIASPGSRTIEGEDSLAGMLVPWGIRARMRGVVAHAVPTTSGQLITEVVDCGDLAIGFEGMPGQNPVTDSLRLAGRRVRLFAARVLERVSPPPGGRVLDLLRSPEDSWYELPRQGTENRYDWKLDGEERARFPVALQAIFPPLPTAKKRPVSDNGTRPESRVIVVGSSDAFANYWLPSNRDFVLNAFNWLAAREYRVHVAKANPETRRIDLKSGALARVTLVGVVLLPGLCLVLGILTAWMRRRR